ncbi:MAG: hypothetical protein IT225_06045 [Flavobacteriales bacterium]|jgi:4-amino-4-deoxy-L-arabinose transferase|nr:hypothetical protein [Flavobacteriales bacterium]
MLGSYFSPAQQLALGAATVIMLAALLAEWKGRSRWSIALLTTAALVLRVFSATLDPFLNQWDECFHALVAKRMVDDPFTPVLYVKGVLPTSSASWTQAHLWLHKPPFFLWQISCS